MKSNIKFREYQKQDASFLEDIIRKTWNYDAFCSPKAARQMASLYLASCLAQQTYNQVALVNNTPIGIIMAKDIIRHKSSLRSSFYQFIEAFPLYLHKEGRKLLKIFAGINEIDLEMLSEDHENYEGEITFFAINEQCRGMGVGKSLFTNAMEYFKGCNIETYYLYTDSSCNFGFYEHQGMVRRNETSRHLPGNSEMNFYLYAGKIS